MKLTDKQQGILARYLRSRRGDRKMTQRLLADKLGVSPAYISKIESNNVEQGPSLKFITHCIEIFGDDMVVTLSTLRMIDSERLRTLAAADSNIALILNRIAMDEG